LLIQRPIDTYCNRFIVEYCHFLFFFSLPNEQENRIKEKKRKKEAKGSAMNGQ